MLEIGSVVDGKYKILNEIGHGGMSVVYLAINERANKTWAIKEVRRDGTTDSAVVVNGLIAETNILKRLSNPHLPSIIDILETPDSLVIVMDYIEGKSLDSLLRHGGAQDPNRVIEWAKQLCDVLGYLHGRERPIIYRDLKPANVMLKPDGTVVLIDFGTAREFKSQNVEDTTCLGTRGYAAPEQFGGHGQTDARTDIYCLGATIYHLITGQSPCEPPYEIKPLGVWLPHLAGSGIEKIVMKCTRPDPAERYQNCAELEYALEHVHEEDDAAKRSRNRMWGGFLACVIVMLLGIAGMVGFTVVGNNTERDTYASYIDQAQTATDEEDVFSYFNKAVELDPSDAEAYNAMLNHIESDLVFTKDESASFLGIVNNTHGGTKVNLSYLKDSDYSSVVYRIANDYYFFYEGNDNRGRAAEWYGKVLEMDPGKTSLSEKQLEVANDLYKIGTYYAMLGGGGMNPYIIDETKYTYNDLWNDLVDVTDGDLADKTGGARYAAALYKELAYQIYINASNFKAADYPITEEEMIEQLDKAEQGLSTLDPEDSSIRELIIEAQEYIDLARDQVPIIFGTVGS